MNDYASQCQVIAKIQHFLEYLQQSQLEKQALAIALGKSEQDECLKDQILIYQELIDHYHGLFKEILHT